MNKQQFKICNYFAQSKHTELNDLLQKHKVTYWDLDGEKIHNQETLFTQVQTNISPLNKRKINGWDSFKDAIWEMLCVEEGEELAIIWSHADHMLTGGLEALVEATHLIIDNSKGYYNSNLQSGQSKLLYLFLLGEGPNFK